MAASRTTAQRAASKAALPVSPAPTPSPSRAAEKFPLMPAAAATAATVDAQPPVTPQPAPQPAPQPPIAAEPAPEREYSIEIRLDSPSINGESAYHVTYPESLVRRLLSGALTWVPVPPRAHLPGMVAPNAARFVYIQAISEIIIHGWSQDDLG